MDPGTLIIFSGLPGSGKSTLASGLAAHLSAVYLRIDALEEGLRDICGISTVDSEGYRLAHRIAQENLRIGNRVIADSVNPWRISRKDWNQVAKEIGASFINSNCSARFAGMNSYEKIELDWYAEELAVI